MVTLVVPVYNMEQYLPRCMESVLAQSSQEYEVVLIDDGSTDSCGVMCDSYAAAYPDLVRVVHKPNGGLSSARNAGIDAAKGDFIIFPDPDDWIEPDYVEAFTAHQKQFQADLVCLGYYVDTDTSSRYGSDEDALLLMSGLAARHALLLERRMQGFCWNKLYRVELIRAHGLRFSAEMGNTEDLAFTYSYLPHCQTVCHAPSKRVYHYYQHASSATRQEFRKEQLGTFRIFEQIMEEHLQTDPDLARIAADEICTTAVNLIWSCEKNGTRDRQLLDFLRGYLREHLSGHLVSPNYGMGRKLQAILALLSPRLYGYLKRIVSREP